MVPPHPEAWARRKSQCKPNPTDLEAADPVSTKRRAFWRAFLPRSGNTASSCLAVLNLSLTRIEKAEPDWPIRAMDCLNSPSTPSELVIAEAHGPPTGELRQLDRNRTGEFVPTEVQDLDRPNRGWFRSNLPMASGKLVVAEIHAHGELGQLHRNRTAELVVAEVQKVQARKSCQSGRYLPRELVAIEC